ncbi:MAG: glycosyltransferase family 9 protein [bacterium]
MKKKVLIIKMGYCETLINEAGFTPSLGDVFRHTVLLHRYAHDHVTWLTTESALPLLADNPLIAELLAYNEVTVADLQCREFDEVVCIEKSRAICELSDSIAAAVHLGFGWNGTTFIVHPLAQSVADIANGRDQFLPIQALLYQMVGDYWRGEGYVLGYSPRFRPVYDVGLNYRVGKKWPTKAWPVSRWTKLERLLLSQNLNVSWQEGEGDLKEYMDWINAGRLIVTCDSLGMHLGLALGKRMVALFGPSPSNGIYMYGRGEIVKATGACGQVPCMKEACDKGTVCMADISPEIVLKVVMNLLAGEAKSRAFRAWQQSLGELAMSV